jgi:hypothetical protein
MRDFSQEPVTAAEQAILDQLAAGATAAGNASVAARPQDPAFWMLLDGHTSTPVVYLKGCYICEDPEFAQMGMPLCRPCPECVKAGRGQGHVAADDTTCDECGAEDGPWNYDERFIEAGLPPEDYQAFVAENGWPDDPGSMRDRQSPEES